MVTKKLDGQRIFAFGSNGSGQLGIGHTEDVAAPVECCGAGTADDQGDIHQLAAGGNHTIVLYGNRRFAFTGDNSDGRCWATVGTKNNRWSTMVVPPSAAGSQGFIGRVAATWSASFGMCTDQLDAIMTTGSGNSGELGLGPDVVVAQEPALIKDFPPDAVKVVKLAACMGHVVALLSTGEVWGWGKGRKGQLGKPYENVWSPRKIEGIPFFAVNAVCGKDFTCIFGLPALGEFVLLGSSGNDRFGIKANAPSSVPGWKQVAASWGSIYVLMPSGEVVSWGRDDRGQLPPRGLPPLESIAAGSEHCLGLTKSGKVLAWGWGEHGNCGIPTDAAGNVKGRWNEIAMSHPVTAVFAGCATSFIATDMDRESFA